MINYYQTQKELEGNYSPGCARLVWLFLILSTLYGTHCVYFMLKADTRSNNYETRYKAANYIKNFVDGYTDQASLLYIDYSLEKYIKKHSIIDIHKLKTEMSLKYYPETTIHRKDDFFEYGDNIRDFAYHLRTFDSSYKIESSKATFPYIQALYDLSSEDRIGYDINEDNRLEVFNNLYTVYTHYYSNLFTDAINKKITLNASQIQNQLYESILKHENNTFFSSYILTYSNLQKELADKILHTYKNKENPTPSYQKECISILDTSITQMNTLESFLTFEYERKLLKEPSQYILKTKNKIISMQ